MSHANHKLVAELSDPQLIEDVRQLLALETQRAPETITEAQIQAYLERLADQDEEPQPPLHALFETRAATVPRHIAIVEPGGGLSYAELNARANRLAQYLRQHGCGSGTVAAIALTPTSELVVALLAVLKAGGAYLLLDLAEPPPWVQARLAAARPDLIITRSGASAAQVASAAPVIALDLVAAVVATQPDSNLDLDVPSDQPACLLVSDEQRVLVAHQALARQVSMVQREFALQEHDRVLCAPVPADAAAWGIFWPLLHGGQVVFMDAPASPATLEETLIDQAVSVLHLLPAQLADWLAHRLPLGASTALRLVLCSGEPLSQQTVDAFYRQLDGRLVWAYAPPEAVTFALMHVCQPGEAREIVPAGAPLDAAVYVLDRHQQPVPFNVSGELYIVSDWLAQPDLEAQPGPSERFGLLTLAGQSVGRSFRTGDRGRRLSSGLIVLEDALDGAIWLRGYRVRPPLIEQALRALPMLHDAAVLARTTTLGVQELVAYVVSAEQGALAAVQQALAASLPAALCPSAYVPLAALPLSADGTVDWHALRQLPVIADVDLQRWEAQVQALPAIDQAAVVLQAFLPAAQRLHLAELLDASQAASDAPDAAAPAAAAGASDSPPSPAWSDGGALSAPGAPPTLGQALRRAAQEWPQHGLRHLLADGAELWQPYPALLEAAERVLAGLRQRGAQPRDIVMVQLELSHELLPAFWGCVLGGMWPVIMPVLPVYQADHSAVEKLWKTWQLLERPLVLVEHAASAARLRAISPSDVRVAQLDELLACAPDHAHHAAAPDDVALLSLTSGSTGLPKCIMLTHQNLLARGRGTNQLCGRSAADVVLNWLPFDHIGSISDWHVRCVDLGCTSVYIAPASVISQPLRWPELMSRYGITHSWAPNFAYALVNEALAQAPQLDWNLAPVRCLLTAGESISAQVVETFLERLAPYGLTRAAMQPAFGMAELGSGVTYFQATSEQPFCVHMVDKRSLGGSGPVRYTRQQSAQSVAFIDLGPVIPGVEMRIVDQQGTVVPEAVVGQLQIRGAVVFSGYYNNPAATADSLSADRWFSTGDLGFSTGGHLVLTGRQKETIIVNGVNHYHHDIEAIVETVSGIDVSYTAACAVRDHATGQDQLAIFFATSTGDDQALSALITQIRGAVARAIGVNPAHIIPLDRADIPKTALGKIQRLQLKQRFEAGEFAAISQRVELLLGGANVLGSWFFRPIWRRSELRQLPVSSAAGTMLVLLDQDGLGAALCELLRAQQRPYVAVSAGPSFQRQHARSYQIAASAPDDYRRLFAALAADQIEVAQVVHCWTYGAAQPDPLAAPALTSDITHGFASLTALIQALPAGSAAQPPLDLWAVASHSQAAGADDELACGRSLLPGLLRTAQQEQPWLHCRHLDLQLDAPTAQALRLLAELDGRDREPEIAYRQGRRLVRRLEQVDPRSHMPGSDCFRPGGRYLLTGGLGGVGREIASYLIERFDAHLLIIGRATLSEIEQADDARWSAWQALQQRSSKVRYAAVDVSDLAALRQSVAQAEQHWQAPLDGALHLAGVAQEQVLAEASAEQSAVVLRPKVFGAWALHQLLKERPGSLLITFSSVNATFGGFGAGTYAAANRFLEQLAVYQRQVCGLNSFCLSWSMWQETGMSRDFRATDLLRARGYQIISPAAALASFQIGLRLSLPTLIIGLDSAHATVRAMLEGASVLLQQPQVFIAGRSEAEADAALRQTELRDRFGTLVAYEPTALAALPRTAAGAIDRELLRRTRQQSARSATPPRSDLERQISAIWRETLKIERISIDDSFFELGGASLQATLAITRINQLFQIDVPVHRLFETPTIAGLARLIEAMRADHQVEASTPIMRASRQTYRGQRARSHGGASSSSDQEGRN